MAYAQWNKCDGTFFSAADYKFSRNKSRTDKKLHAKTPHKFCKLTVNDELNFELNIKLHSYPTYLHIFHGPIELLLLLSLL